MATIISTERTSDEYLTLNSCGIEYWSKFDGFCLRENGRVDYHLLYVKEGFCHLTVDKQTIKVPQGNIIFSVQPNASSTLILKKTNQFRIIYILQEPVASIF